MNNKISTAKGAVVAVVLKKYQHHRRSLEVGQLELLEELRHFGAGVNFPHQVVPHFFELYVFCEGFYTFLEYLVDSERMRRGQFFHGLVSRRPPRILDDFTNGSSISVDHLHEAIIWAEQFFREVFELFELLNERFIGHVSSWNRGWMKLLIYYNNYFKYARTMYAAQ